MTRSAEPSGERQLDIMKAVSKCGLLFAVALMACAAVATSAQAQITITPPGHLTAQATDPTLSYGGVTIVCATGTATGTVDGSPSDNTITDLTVTFQGNCNINGQPATVDCVGDATLTATQAHSGGPDGEGTVTLHSGFDCEITVPFTCTVDVVGPQAPIAVNQYVAATVTLFANVTVNATRTGSANCGPASGDATFTADYVVETPVGLTITDP